MKIIKCTPAPTPCLIRIKEWIIFPGLSVSGDGSGLARLYYTLWRQWGSGEVTRAPQVSLPGQGHEGDHQTTNTRAWQWLQVWYQNIHNILALLTTWHPRSLLKEIKLAGNRRIILDCSSEKIHQILIQAQQVGMMTGRQNYFSGLAIASSFLIFRKRQIKHLFIVSSLLNWTSIVPKS